MNERFLIESNSKHLCYRSQGARTAFDTLDCFIGLPRWTQESPEEQPRQQAAFTTGKTAV